MLAIQCRSFPGRAEAVNYMIITQLSKSGLGITFNYAVLEVSEVAAHAWSYISQ